MYTFFVPRNYKRRRDFKFLQEVLSLTLFAKKRKSPKAINFEAMHRN